MDVLTMVVSKLSETGILGALGILALLVLLVPVALKFAGLTGQQIADVLTLTLRFVVDLVRAFREQNADRSK